MGCILSLEIVKYVTNTQSVAAHLVGICRTYALSGGANLVFTFLRLVGCIKYTVCRHNKMCLLRNMEALLQLVPAGFKCHCFIQRDAVAWAVGVVTPDEIDQINILNASILAMHRALDQLTVRPEAIIVDGNRFKPYCPVVDGSAVNIPHTTIVKGDGKYLSIAAASILAKTYRDDYMDELAEQYPQYDWKSNKGYPTKKHREAIRQFGITPFHRKSFNMLGDGQLSLDFGE